MAARRPRRPQVAHAGRTVRPSPADAAQPDTEGDSWRQYFARVKEGDFQQQILTLCHRLGYLAFHDPDARTCPRCGALVLDQRVRGFPDLVIVRPPAPGRRGPLVLFVELKTMRGRVREEQRVWGAYLGAIARLVPGVYYGVWRPSDWALIETLLLDPPQEPI